MLPQCPRRDEPMLELLVGLAAVRPYSAVESISFPDIFR